MFDPPFVYPQTIVNSNDSSPATSETINNMSTINYPTNYALNGQSINHASIHPSSLTSPGTTISNHNQSPINLQSINPLNNNNLSNIPPSPISLASSSSLSSASLSSFSSITPTPTPTTTAIPFNFLSIDDNNLPDLPQHTAQLPHHSLPSSSSSSLIIQHQPHHFYQQPYQQYHPQQIISPAPSSPLSSIFDYRDYSSSSTADEIDMPEFLQYNREKYENSRSGTNRRRRRPSNNNNSINNDIGANNNDGNNDIINNNNSYNGINTSNNNGFNHNHNHNHNYNNITNTQQHFQQQPLQLNDNQFDNSSMDEVYEMIDDNNNSRQGSVNPLNDDSNNFTSLSHAEFRRQIHIQSEQKRRAEIKDGFDELRKQLPITYANRKMSKALLLQKAVAHMKNMQRKENFLLDEINRLSQRCIYMNAELENEKRMNYLYRQKHNLNKLYQIGL